MGHFTLGEAKALLPWLGERLTTLAELGRQQAQLQVSLQHHMGPSGRVNGTASHGQAVQIEQRRMQDVLASISKVAQEIEQRGIVLRDSARGLVDFPSLREGREVHLCWLNGEGTINFWHEKEAGFAGRQPL
jgi:hypothetical protein